MRLLHWIMILLVVAATAAAQQLGHGTNSLFDKSAQKTFDVKTIDVEGEVDSPGLVDLEPLPLRSIPVKELAEDNGRQVFKGAYWFSGYALCDVLNVKKLHKAAGNNFAPPIDAYVIIENALGGKVVVSWGELYYTRDGGNILIAKSVRAIDPANGKTKWPLPENPRLICGNDRLNVRYLNNPTKISVRSYLGTLATKKPDNTYSPEVKIVTPELSASVADMGPAVEMRKYGIVGYGHGGGFKEVQSVTGFLVKDVLAAKVNVSGIGLAKTIVVVSSKDSYRSVFSASEILDRNDNQEFLLIDRKDAQEGRYSLFVNDFFLDRNVKAVEKIELVNVK